MSENNKIEKYGDFHGKYASAYPAVNPLITLLFNLYVVTWYLELNKRVEIFGKIRFEFILGSILIILATGTIFRDSTHSRNNPIVKYITLLFIYLLIHLPLSVDIDVSWWYFFNRVIKFAFMSYFIVAFIRNPKELKIFILIWFLVFMKIGLESFIGKITGSMVWENQGVMRLWGDQNSMYGHPSSLAGTALGTMPFIIYLFPNVNKFLKILLVIQSIFVINILIFTGSRTGYVGAIIFFLFLYLKSNYKIRIFFIGIILILLSIILIPGQYKERFDSIFVGEEKEGHSKRERIEIKKDALVIFMKYPFGAGMGTFKELRKKELGKTEMDTHDLYLEVLTNIGLLGLVIFIAFIFKMMKYLNFFKNDFDSQINSIIKFEYLEDRDIGEHINNLRFLRGITDAIYLFLVIRLGLGLFGHDFYEIYWWFAAGLTIAIHNIGMIAREITYDLLKV